MIDIVDTNAFIREPVYDICKQLKNNDKNKIMLTGGRGVGKTTVLKSMEKSSIGHKDQTIYSKPGSSIMFVNNPNSDFNKEFFNHYYELVISDVLLSHIRKYYSLTYNKEFKKEDELMDLLIDEIKNCIKERKDLIKSKISTKEISEPILSKIKCVLELEKVSLILDRFDHINGASNYTQKLLSTYFDLFDKVYLTCDDVMINMKKRSLENKGFFVNEINYGNDKEILKEIIRKRIEFLNNEYNLNINNDLFISDNMIDLYLSDEYNINTIIDTIRDTKDIKTDDEMRVMKLKLDNNMKDKLAIAKTKKSPIIYF